MLGVYLIETTLDVTRDEGCEVAFAVCVFSPPKQALHGVGGALSRARAKLSGAHGGSGVVGVIRHAEAVEDDPFEGLADYAQEVYGAPAFRVRVRGFVSLGNGDDGSEFLGRGVKAAPEDFGVYCAQGGRVNVMNQFKKGGGNKIRATGRMGGGVHQTFSDLGGVYSRDIWGGYTGRGDECAGAVMVGKAFGCVGVA